MRSARAVHTPPPPLVQERQAQGDGFASKIRSSVARQLQQEAPEWLPEGIDLMVAEFLGNSLEDIQWRFKGQQWRAGQAVEV